MRTNEIPVFDVSDNETGCCPRFHPEPWDEKALHFENRPFVRASTVSFFHMPLNMGSVFTHTFEAIKEAHAGDGAFLVLSRDDSAWHEEHLFAVSKEVPGADMVHLSGDFLTKVFEGPYKDAPKWGQEMRRYVQDCGKTLDKMYYFYTTCPKCAKHYGKNYVVGVAQVH